MRRKITHINRALPISGHPPMYIFHRYFARKQSTVIAEYIDHYSNPGDIVLDPFCGSGVHVIEAVRLGRKGFGIDLNPQSIFLSRNTIRYIAPTDIISVFRKLQSKLEKKISNIYLTRCRTCGDKIPAICFTWQDDKMVDVRYYCPTCNKKKINPVDKLDISLYRKIEHGKLESFFDESGNCRFYFPTAPLYYDDGTPFMKKEKFETMSDVFTKRNLIALAMLLNQIEKIKNPKLRDIFKCGFTSMVHLASRMTPVRPTRPYSSLWAQHSYWAVPYFMESNVWNLFESAITGRQGIQSAKEDLSVEFKDKHEVKNFKSLQSNGDYLFINNDAIRTLDKIPTESVDYVITDPPYGNSIQYGELLYIWESWIKLDKDLSRIRQDEIIVNPRQNKNDEEYENLLYVAFREIYRVLKSERYCTVTFHSPKLKYRNILFRAVVRAGFDFEKIIYQPPARPSAKGLLQPFGSLTGDYFFRFKKPESRIHKETYFTHSVEKGRVERIIIETTKKIIAERGEPTHYTFIQNAIDPLLYGELRKYGLLMEFNPSDIETILKSRIDKDFILVDMNIGQSGQKTLLGKGWWFKNPRKHKMTVPLNKRVDEAIVNLLRREREVTYTEVTTEIYTKFENSLTPDEHTIKDILSLNATQVKGGRWRAKPFVEEIVKKHEEMVYYLGVLGKNFGYKVDIATDEYGKKFGKTTLRQLLTPDKFAPGQIEKEALKRINAIDVIWHNGKEAVAIFEVEHSTSIVDAVIRGSHIENDIPRVIVIPKQREDIVFRRFSEPAMVSIMEDNEWLIITYDELARFYKNHKKIKTASSEKFLKILKEPLSAKQREQLTQQTLEEYEE